VADAGGLLLNSEGMDVEALLHARNAFGEIDRGALDGSVEQSDREDWLTVDCDVLVPAAIADAINESNCDRVRAPLIVEAAKLPTTTAAEAALTRRGVTVIPDFVANSGTNGWIWWLVLGEVDPAPEPL
jgi:glutamate dehydrogenase (NAD(P)+)